MKSTLTRAAVAAVIGFCCAVGSAKATKRLLGVFVLWLFTVVGANAMVFDVSATDNDGTGVLGGTVTIDTSTGVVTAVDLTFSDGALTAAEGNIINTLKTFNASVGALGQPSGPVASGYLLQLQGLNLVGYNGGAISSWSVLDVIDNKSFSGSGGTLTAEVSATPLPAALPLYATGLGALALLRWRRKRKAAAALIAA